MSDAAAPTTSDRGRRLAVSLAVAVLFVASEWVPLPVALTGIGAAIANGRPGPSIAGTFCLSLESIFDAAIIVELFAVIVPRWRSLRLSGPAGRGRLWTATMILGLVLVAFQSFFMVRWLQRSDSLGYDPATAVVVIATMTAGVALKVAAAQAVSRFGLGNGFSVIIVATIVRDVIVAAVRSEAPLYVQAGPNFAKRMLLLVVVAAFAAWALVRERRRASAGAALPFPASAIQPLTVALGLPAIVVGLTAFDVAKDLAQAFRERTIGTQAIQAAIVVVGAVALTWAFNGPKRIAGAVPDPRRALLEAAARAIVFLLLLGAAQTALTAAGAPLDVLSIVMLVAVALDLWGEWRARGAGKWVPVWPMARPYSVEGALAALRAAGIAAYPRALHNRTLLQALGPYVTIDLLVPEARAAEAQQVLEAGGTRS